MRYLTISGYTPDRVHVIECEVQGAREARQLLEAYVDRYPDHTFVMKAGN